LTKKNKGYYSHEEDGGNIMAEYDINKEEIEKLYNFFVEKDFFKIKGKKSMNTSGSDKGVS
jgi:hypothetical protein